MALSEANRVSISYAAEVTEGVTPAVAFQKIPYKTSSIDAQINTTMSETVNASRKTDELFRMSGSTSGDIAVELAYGPHEPFLESVFGNSFTTFTLTGTTVSASSVDNSFNDSGTGFNTTTIKPGMFIRTSGFATAANNGIHLVVSATSAKIVVSAASTLVTEAAGATVTVKCNTLRTGTTKKFFSIQRAFEDINKFSIHRGMIVSNMTLNVASGAIVDQTFSFMGQDTEWSGTSFSTGVELAAPAWQGFTATANVGKVYEDGNDTNAAGVFFKSINLTVNPNVRALDAVGNFYAVAHNLGRFEITAQCEAYFGNSDLLQKLVDGSATSISYQLIDPSGDTYVVYLPYCKISAGTTSGIQINSDTMQSVTFTALNSPTEDFMAQISKL